MKKNYLLVVIFLSFFSFDSSAIVIKINNHRANLEAESFSPHINPNSGLINKTSLILLAPISNPTVSSTSICEGDNLTLTANPSEPLVAPYTFEWTGPNGYTSTVENPVINNVVEANEGVYTLTIFDALDNIIDVQNTPFVTVNAKVTPTFSGIPAGICYGSTPPTLSSISKNGITGTWSPAVVSNTANDTYTFTPNPGQCANPYSFFFTITPNETTTFLSLPLSICEGEPAPILPGSSDEGIPGSWSPAVVNNTTTANYNFTPSPGLCAELATVTITVNPTLAVFTPAFPPICSGDFLAPLPTTSTNGINGTWSPAVDNTTTTTYTFTPDPGQCSITPVDMDIVVNPIAAIFTQVPPICPGDPLADLPTTSDNGVTGTWAPAMNNTVTTTYTFTPDVAQCTTNPTTMTIVVNPVVALFTQVPPICPGDPLANLPIVSDNGVTGTWSPAMDNTVTTTYTFTPDPGQCTIDPTTMTIVVNPTTAIFTQVPPICSGDALAMPTTSDNGVTGTWAPAIDNTTTTTYTFTPDPGQCAITTVDMTIVVNPITAVFTQVPPICPGDPLANLPTTSDNGVTGTWSPAMDNTVTTTYTFTPDAAQCTINPTTMTIVVNPLLAVFTQIPPICSGDALVLPTTSDNGVIGTWSPAIDNTTTTTYTFTPDPGQCAIITVDMTIVVNPITAVFTQVPPICPGDPLANLPTTSDNGVTGTWSPAMDNTVTTTYTFTPDAAQCTTNPTTMTIVVNKLLVIFTQVPPICSGDVLTNLPTTSDNGVMGTWSPAINNMVTTTYTFTSDTGQCDPTPITMTIVVNQTTPIFTQVPSICPGDALANLPTTSDNGVMGTWSPAIDNTVTTTYTFTPDPGQCATTTVDMTIVVNPPTVIFTQVPPICSGDALSLSTTSDNGVTGSWSPAIDNTATTTYTFTPHSGLCINNQVSMTIVVNPTTAIFTQVPSICLGDALANLPTISDNGVTGTWSPAMDNTATTTYTFTPDAGQCTTNPTTMTIVVNPTTAVFTQVPPICSGDALALSTTSDNGVTGTWSPAIDNTTTTTYTFTPDVGQCATTSVDMTIVVNPTTAVFTQVPPICPGDPLADLPTTSDNGVTGTWSPAMDNTVTTTYTFTPDVAQCTTNPTTMTIVVNPVTVIFAQIQPICSGDALTLSTTSDNGVTGTWSPAGDNTTTTTYTFTPTAGQCATTAVDMTIVVNPITAVFTQVPSICPGDALSNLPTTSDNGVTGTWSPAMNNTVTTTYTFTPDAGQCNTNPTTMTIVVNPLTVVFNQIAAICLGDALTLATTSDNGVTGTWAPAIDNTATTTYTFTPDVGQCATSSVDMTVVVNPTTAVFTQVPPICSGDALTDLPTTSDNGVTGNWSPAMDNTVTTTYTFTPDAGQCAINPTTMTIVVNPLTVAFNQIAPICLGDALTLATTSDNGVTGTWFPAVDNTATTTYTFTPTAGQCATTPVDMTVVVNPTTITFTQVAQICEGDALANLPTTSDNGVTGTWSPAIDNTTTTTYTFTPTPGQCATADVDMMIVVNPKITPTFNPIPDVCYGSATIPTLPATSINGITGTWNPATVSNTTPGNYIFTPDASFCANQGLLSININVITPLFDPIAEICQGATAPTLPLTSTNGISGTWLPATVDTSTSGTVSYVFTPAPEQCATETSLPITISPTTAVFDQIAPICAGDALVLPTVSKNGVKGSWLPLFDNTQTKTYTFTPDGGQCTPVTATFEMEITVNQKITPAFTAIAPICSGETSPVLPLTSNNGITGTWNPAMVSNTATDTYIFTPTIGECGLPTTLSITVYQSPTDIAFTTTDVVNDGPDGIIEIGTITSGMAPFEYKINNGSFTTDITYSNLLSGNYTITVKDSNGCEFSTAATINSICVFPNAISPNNDTFNDTFNLNGCNVDKLTLFNRYGREVNKYNNYSDQWDGTTNKGEHLPDGTYFYVAEIKDGTSKTGWIYVSR